MTRRLAACPRATRNQVPESVRNIQMPAQRGLFLRPGFIKLSDIVVLVFLINRVKVIQVIILFVFIVKNALSVYFNPGFLIVEFMIEQMVVLGLWNINLIAHLHFLH